MSAWLENIQLQVSRRIPQSHALMSPAMSAKAGLGHASMSAHRRAVAENAMANPRLADGLFEERCHRAPPIRPR